MSEFDASVFCLPPTFDGRVRLFPLPNFVMFPYVLAPLHIFEPRYRDLMKAALEDDQLIAMATLASGWQQDYEGRPPVATMACVGRIAMHHQLPDGRYNLLLQGLKRIRIDHELPAAVSYREAMVTVCEDRCAKPIDQRALFEALSADFRRRLPQSQAAQSQFEQWLASSPPLGMLADMMAHALDFSCELKLTLLEELDVERRVRLILETLRGTSQSDWRVSEPFPPPFSDN